MNKKSTILLLVVLAVFGATRTAMALPPPENVPDAGSSSALLGTAVLSLAGLRCVFGKKS